MTAFKPQGALAPEESGSGPDRPLPQSLQELGLPEIFLANLTLKHCFFLEVFYLAELTERIKLSATINPQPTP
ncbi:MAG: hypothetical protein JRI59_04950 [Deltaproteobacteria bacterium]|nr:hypothetical protein [Deltaproteobacteria bacterium]